MKPAVLHDGEQVVLILKQRDVAGRVAAHQQQIREISGLDATEFLLHAHDLPAGLVAAIERFDGCESQVPDEQFQVARIASVGIEGKAIVAAGQQPDSPALELAARASFGAPAQPRRPPSCGSCRSGAAAGIQRRLHDPNRRSDEYLGLAGRQHVDGLLIRIGTVIQRRENRSALPS